MSESEAPVIRIKRILPAKRWKVLRLITRVEEFSRIMPNVKKCQVLSRTGRVIQTAWQIDMDGIPLSWKQEETFDFKNFAISFRSTEGDLEELKGEWTLKPAGENQTEVEVVLSIKIGIPQLEEFVKKMLVEKIHKNFSAMFDAFEEMIAMQRYRRIADRKQSDISGFAVMCHPYNYNHLVKYIQYFKKDLKLPSREFLSKIFESIPAYVSYELKTFKSKTGKVTHGNFIMCPFVPDMLKTDLKAVVKKVVEGCKQAERLGLGIMALGGFTSIAGEMNNKSIRQMVNIPVTTGNTYTVALALQGVRKAAQLMGMDFSQAKVTIIGGAGDIGGGCAKILTEEVKEITITSRNPRNLVDAERSLAYGGRAKIRTSSDNREAVKDADIVIAAASSTEAIVGVDDFKCGAIVCDIGYPKNISHSKSDRKDIFVFSGGICSLPYEFDFGFDVGLPSTLTLYGCYAEAIILDLEERYQNFSEGKGNITKEKVHEISEMAQKHGFGLAPFFWGEKLLTEKDIQELREARQETVLKHGG
ncbi:MAG: hypothetical protein EXS63_03480 [Candidatus Omnitrophica bacterium]|nr:hypothetical protein [Candidatus Omnitrophota bacterium]